MTSFAGGVSAIGLGLAAVLTIACVPANFLPAAIAKGEIHNLSSPAEVIEEVVANKPYATCKLLVKASPEQVWKVLTDYDNATYVFPNLKKCQVLEDHGSTKIVNHEVNPSGLPGTFKYVLQVKETAPTCLEWHRLRGDFREVDGYWKLEPVENGRSTLVTYSSHVNAGFFIPYALVRRQMRIDMPGVMAQLKEHAEAETSVAKIAGRPEQQERHN